MQRKRSVQLMQFADDEARYVFWKDPGVFGCVLMGLFCATVLVKLLSPEDGILKVQEVKRIKAQFTDEIAQLEQANARLRHDIEVMRTDPFQQEKIAREELNLALPGEIIYKFAE